MQEINIYTDGGSRGNPGPAAIGIWVESLNKKYSQTIGVATNNDAEYQALIFALKKVKLLVGKQKAKSTKLNCFLDSELIVKQLNHEYKINAENTQRYFIEVWNLILDFGDITFTHIRREKNKVADSLVNKALDEESDQAALF
ncbi:MAG: ribonuclease HI family protein [Candidatus Moranbacteria bacterium]|nr:ribonuclease HI family protein [Candidatus Moranbacteria bacterium]